MSGIVFKKLSVKEKAGVRAGERIRDRFLGDLCTTPDRPGASCDVKTPNLTSCGSRKYVSFRPVNQM